MLLCLVDKFTKPILGKIYGNSGMIHFALCRSKSGPFPLLNVAAYFQCSNTETCAKKLSQILTNNIDNGGEGDWSQDLCEVLSKKINEKQKGVWENLAFFLA